MEKMIWEKPQMNEVAFAANEYVAACWSVNCNVPYGKGYFETNGESGYQEGTYHKGYYDEENHEYVPGYYEGGDQFIASGKGCNKLHEVSGVDAAGPRANAWWQTSAGEVFEVFYFQARGDEWGDSNHHFAIVDEEHVNWAPNPNASN